MNPSHSPTCPVTRHTTETEAIGTPVRNRGRRLIPPGGMAQRNLSTIAAAAVAATHPTPMNRIRRSRTNRRPARIYHPTSRTLRMSRITRMIRELTFRTNRRLARMYLRMSRGPISRMSRPPAGMFRPTILIHRISPANPACRRPDSSGGLSCCSQQWVQS